MVMRLSFIALRGFQEVKPVLQALVLAEHVYTDQRGKKIICGTFNGLTLRKKSPDNAVQSANDTQVKVVPDSGFMGSPWTYISLTDVWDNTKLQLQFVSLKRNFVLFETEFILQCNDRLKNIEIVAPLPMLDIPEPGCYAFEVVWEGEIIGSHRIVAREHAE